jgi:isoleucyl-tRNA synthetase
VHLTDWPRELDHVANPTLVAEMDRVRDVCSAALSLRSAQNVRVRQPLRSLTVAGQEVGGLSQYKDLIEDEVNVKEVRFTDEIETYATFRLQVDSRALGPRLGKAMKEVIRASKAGEWETIDDGDSVRVAGHELQPGEYSLLLQPRDGVVCEALPSSDTIVVLDLALDEDLVAEGHARDVVRAVQQARKEADLHVSDRIRLALELPEELSDAVSKFAEYVCDQTLTTELDLGGDLSAAGLSVHEATVGGESIRVGVARA